MAKDLSKRPTVAEIHLDAIALNIDRIAERVRPARVMAVVKADAYGHGAARVARTATEHGASYLGVAIPEEGVELRKEGIKDPILVFSSPAVTDLDLYFQYDLTCTVCDASQIKPITEAARYHDRELVCHVNVDTGMGRLGLSRPRINP